MAGKVLGEVCKIPVNSHCDGGCPGFCPIPLVHAWPLQLFQGLADFFVLSGVALASLPPMLSPCGPDIAPREALPFLDFKLFGCPQPQTSNGFRKNYDFVV